MPNEGCKEGYENYNEVVQFTGGIFALVLHGIGF